MSHKSKKQQSKPQSPEAELKNERFEAEHLSHSKALDDEQRVKVLSPSMLVFRRFIRNKLAIVGVAILAVMAVFSIVGPILSPYRQDQVFYRDDQIFREFAGVKENNEFRYSVRAGADFGSAPQSRFILAVAKKQQQFEDGKQAYTLHQIHEHAYAIGSQVEVASGLSRGKILMLKYRPGFTEDPQMEMAASAAIGKKADSFTYQGTQYFLRKSGPEWIISHDETIALASYNIIDLASPDQEIDIDLRVRLEEAYAEALKNKQSTTRFDFNNQNYRLQFKDEEAAVFVGQGKDPVASISRYLVQPVQRDVFITPDFKETILQAVKDGTKEFKYALNSGSQEQSYRLERQNNRWLLSSLQQNLVVDAYRAPSLKHPVGLDGNGMDLMTRLMYGGRISLSIGFVVVTISLLIGVTLGGLSGYFGGWVDMLIMRIVDIFYCIPTWPILIIFGSIMDTYRINVYVRLFYLMIILGVLGWAGIARLVRGQILSLREQEFMVAAEASGLSVYRRIFKHLVPNVIPQLIIVATGTLGGIILTESTLSFLGLGVKYPIASWGNIITAVSDVNVMVNFTHAWIPAGFCILATVLGFNFVGDGLRDAFDPRMKR